jgi:hypothetical protein
MFFSTFIRCFAQSKCFPSFAPFNFLTLSHVLKFRVFWDVAPCSHIEVDRRFRGAYCLMVAVCTSETSVNINVTTWRYIPQTPNVILTAMRTWNLTFTCFILPFPFFSENISNTVLSDGVTPYKGRKCWQYFAGLQQNILLCRHKHLVSWIHNPAIFLHSTQIQLCDYMHLCVHL